MFLTAYFPHIAILIDWAQAVEWLDKEIEKIISHKRGEKGKRVDLLARVQLLDGTSRIILLHIEIQSEKDDQLPLRIHRYWSGLHFHTGEQVISLVILADLDAQWHPKSSVVQFGGFKSEIHFETCKLLDLKLEDPTLRGIPYEVARAQIASLRTRNDPVARYRTKKELLLNLYQCGNNADDIRETYWLIDHMMFLSEELKKQLNLEILEYEKEKVMPFISSIEEHFIEKNRAEGAEIKALRIAEKMILAGKPDEEIVEFTELPLNLVRELRRKIATPEK